MGLRFSFGTIAIIAAVIGVISLVLAPTVFVIGMISVIGIPLALLAVIVPTICLLVVLAYVVYRIWPSHTAVGIARSFLIALLIMLVVPLVYNIQVKRAVAGLTSGDLGAVLEPLKPNETLVVFGNHRSSQKCFNTCIDLLLTKQIGGWIAAQLPRGSSQPDSAAKATLHRLEPGSDCENKLVIPKNKSSNTNRPGTVAHALKAAAERGMCIRSTQIDLADAGPLRAIVHSDRKTLDYPERAVFIDTMIRPSRIAVFEYQRETGWSKLMQQTNVSYSMLGPVLAHTIPSTTISSTRSSWWRNTVNEKPLSIDGFLKDKMGVVLRRQ
jgi:hypothetical protein